MYGHSMIRAFHIFFYDSVSVWLIPNVLYFKTLQAYVVLSSNMYLSPFLELFCQEVGRIALTVERILTLQMFFAPPLI